MFGRHAFVRADIAVARRGRFVTFRPAGMSASTNAQASSASVPSCPVAPWQSDPDLAPSADLRASRNFFRGTDE